MTVVDEGHEYLLDVIDGGPMQRVVFVKREGPGYPLNVGHHGGTQSQEAFRILINRAQYVDSQIKHEVNTKVGLIFPTGIACA